MSVNENIDFSINLKNDFYSFCNGNWIETNKIPEKYSRWGTFEEVFEKNQKNVIEIIKNCQKNNGLICQQIFDLYKTGTDIDKRNRQGIQPIIFLIDKINNIKSKKNVIETIALLHSYEIDCLFSIYVDADSKDSTMNRLHFNHSVLGMPDRDYYLSEEFKYYQIKYLKYIKNLLLHLKHGDREYFKNIFNFEKHIAEISLSKEIKRDPVRCYNKLSIKKSLEKFKNLYLDHYLNVLNINPEYIIFDDINFYNKIGLILKYTNLETWKEYLIFCLMNSMSPYLSSYYDKNYFNFYGKILSGQRKQKPLNEKITNTVNLYLEESIGTLFVEKYFNKKSKEYVENMIIEFKEVLRVMILNLSWMDNKTKKKAIKKLNSIEYKIGYPCKSTLKDYSHLEITTDSYSKNILSCKHFDFSFDIKELDKKVNKKKWHMGPQTINAYYNPTCNEIVFPAAILQPPFFSITQCDAQNYGGIGCIIGHEITHAFDDQGCLFDYAGNLHNWWTTEDKKKFMKESKKMKLQFDAYKLENMKINGSLTLGENIADYGGIKIALNALIRKNNNILKEQKKNEITEFKDFTTIQKFFIYYANIWKCIYTKEYLTQQINSDPHSPNILRVNGPLSILNEFHNSFDINENNNLFINEGKRCNIW
jgi:putative endopeptidase